MNIVIGSDHAGYELKEYLKSKFSSANHPWEDKGPYTSDSVDYPDYAHSVANFVEDNGQTLGILICGSANGVAMTANKHSHIRAAICWNPEIASLARQHNDANILCLPARFISFCEAEEITKAFLDTTFEGGRHQRRVDKIACR